MSVPRTEKIEILEEQTPLYKIVGPIFLVLALAFGSKTIPVFNYDLLLVAVIGLFVAAKWQIRGCCYVFACLAILSVLKHLWIQDHHVLQAVLEISVGFSILVNALVYEQGVMFFSSIQQQMDSRAQTIRYLEEDIEKIKENSLFESASKTEKLAVLQQNLEEVQSELGALQILNEVLRKSSANAIEEKSTLGLEVLRSQSQLSQLLQEVDLLQKELNRLADESELVKQNQELFQELNSARCKEEQSHLVNETLVRLHAQQDQKIKEFEARHTSLSSEVFETAQQMELCKKEIQESEEQKFVFVREIEELRGEKEKIKESLRLAQEEKKALNGQFLLQIQSFEMQAKQSQEQLELFRSSMQGLQKLHEETLANLAQEHHEQVQVLSQKLEQASRIGPLYRQLKEQFEEKNKVLHQTRSELFSLDNELQTMKIQLEQKQLETDLFPVSFHEELEKVELENAMLVEENDHLQNLVTDLMSSPELRPIRRVKKKIKTYSPDDQATLF